MSTSAVVPLVFWGSTPPKHVVTCILVTYDQKTIITGSKSGQLGVWDIRHLEGGKVEVDTTCKSVDQLAFLTSYKSVDQLAFLSIFLSIFICPRERVLDN